VIFRSIGRSPQLRETDRAGQASLLAPTKTPRELEIYAALFAAGSPMDGSM
jgi:hypothetical protein